MKYGAVGKGMKISLPNDMSWSPLRFINLFSSRPPSTPYLLPDEWLKC